MLTHLLTKFTEQYPYIFKCYFKALGYYHGPLRSAFAFHTRLPSKTLFQLI